MKASELVKEYKKSPTYEKISSFVVLFAYIYVFICIAIFHDQFEPFFSMINDFNFVVAAACFFAIAILATLLIYASAWLACFVWFLVKRHIASNKRK